MKSKVCSLCREPHNKGGYCSRCGKHIHRIKNASAHLELLKAWISLGRGTASERSSKLEEAENLLDAQLEGAEQVWGRARLMKYLRHMS